PLTDFGGKTSIFSHPVYLFLREFSLQDSRGGSSLRADVSAGRKRLQVAATCAKSTTGASGMGDGESPGLTADAELNYYRLRSGIDKITAQVNYLQEYIRTQCLR
ncbi:lysis protein, partial [Escherichia coli]